MNEKIHYDEFVEQIVLKSGYDEETVREYLSVMFETIIMENTHGNPVKLRNFGSFQPRWYKAKRGINPQTGEPLDILPHYHIHFASSKVLKNALNDEPEESSFLLKLILFLIVALLAGFLFYFTQSVEKSVERKIVKEVEVTEEVKPVEQKVLEPKVVEDQEVEVKQQVAHTIEETETTKPKYPGSYKIQLNDTLSEIGSEVYGNKGYWPLLFSANNSKLSDPDLILSGDSLVVPDKIDSKQLYSSYMEVHNAYKQRFQIGKSFWILCEGTNFIGKDFQIYLKDQLTPVEYPIIQRCSKNR